jgi:hypothetical protein
MPVKLIGKEQIMKRIPRWSALAGAVIAALSLLSLTATSNAQPDGYDYGGGYGPGYGGYPIYGQGPYVYGSPAAYPYPAYGGYRYEAYGAGPYGYDYRSYAPRGYARTYSNYRTYSPYRAYSPYDDPHYAPFGYQSHSLYYRSHHGY